MKKILSVFTVFIFSTVFVFAEINSSNEFLGRWAEKISERVIMDIFLDNNEYQIFITWRENNIAQKDIYRFSAQLDKNNTLKYTNGVHIIRTYDLNGNFQDVVEYADGTGNLKVNNDEILWTDNKDNTESIFVRPNKNLAKSTIVKNKLFEFNLPEELKGFYTTKINKDRISIYDTSSKNAGFGGFAFGIKAYKNPSEHATLPGGVKIGELTDKKGRLYDMVLKYPTDVQYDYTKFEKTPDSYRLLYNLGKFINIKGRKGSIFYKNQGMKGEDLYKDVLKKHIAAKNEKWDSIKLEHEKMSYMYNLTDKIGYAFYDVNKDGIEELFIGEIADGNWKGIIYDMYTMVDRVPKHVVSGGARNRYFVCDDAFICNEYSSGALESGVRVYTLLENSTELFPQVSFKYDAYSNKNNPWFISYGNEVNKDSWENVDEKVLKERKAVFDRYNRFDFIPLNQYSQN